MARRAVRHILFLQVTDPANYPPLLNAAKLFAEAGWKVTFLSLPIKGSSLIVAAHPQIEVLSMPARSTHVVSIINYLRYCARAAIVGLCRRPDVIYASDPLGAAPGLLASTIAFSSLVYHEHDSPNTGSMRFPFARLRVAAARKARLVIFPNRSRAVVAQGEIGFGNTQLRIVWNLPCRAELPTLDKLPDSPLIVYFHGSIGPDRLPKSVVEAVSQFRGRVRLRVAGYESPGARGYLAKILELGSTGCDHSLVEYLGEIPREMLLKVAARAHVGLAFMPRKTNDINMQYMVGASNKPFDYMAAGQALLVSDLSDWRDMFVSAGYARACDPADTHSVAAALKWFLEHTEERRDMAALGRAKIAADWNYETAFATVIAELANG